MAPIKALCYLTLIIAVFAIMAIHRAIVVNPLDLRPFILTGKTIIVTGGTDGIGKETAKTLASWGAHVILPVRNLEKATLVKQEIDKLISETNTKGSVELIGNVDFASFDSIRSFAKQLGNKPIDVLVNNAGMMNMENELTVDKIETVFQVNHLSPFLLTKLLLPNLKKNIGRVVFVSSNLHYVGDLNLEKYTIDNKGMSNLTVGVQRYHDTKLMNVMTAKLFHDKYAKTNGVTFTSVHPGYVISNLDGNMPGMLKTFAVGVRSFVGRTTPQGAVAQITLATHPGLATPEVAGGKFFADYCMNNLCTAPCYYCDVENSPGVKPNKQALRAELREFLWKTSCKLTGVPE